MLPDERRKHKLNVLFYVITRKVSSLPVPNLSVHLCVSIKSIVDCISKKKETLLSNVNAKCTTQHTHGYEMNERAPREDYFLPKLNHTSYNTDVHITHIAHITIDMIIISSEINLLSSTKHTPTESDRENVSKTHKNIIHVKIMMETDAQPLSAPVFIAHPGMKPIKIHGARRQNFCTNGSRVSMFHCVCVCVEKYTLGMQHVRLLCEYLSSIGARTRSNPNHIAVALSISAEISSVT